MENQKRQGVTQQWGKGKSQNAKGKGKKGKGKGKNGKGGKSAGSQAFQHPGYCQQDKDGKWFCRDYSRGGCMEPCPHGALHLCNIRTGPKSACKEKHPACNHFSLGFN